MRLGEEIAVLDGLELGALPQGVLPHRNNVIDPNGGQYTGGNSYSPYVPMLPSSAGLAAVDMDLVQQMNVLSRRSFDPSDGGNRAGGSDYSPGLPLLPSSSGLSNLDAAGSGTSIRADIIDASEGGNYSGGSSYAEGLPLLPSSAGLAGMQFAEADLMVQAGALKARRNVIDPNEGQYTGGSSYSPFVPMLPSSSGLAGLDAVPDGTMLKILKTPSQKGAFAKAASKGQLDQRKQALSQHQVALNKIKRGWSAMSLAQRSEKQAALESILTTMRNLAQSIDRIRGVRYGMLQNAAQAPSGTSAAVASLMRRR
jgi:hypothetical protein